MQLLCALTQLLGARIRCGRSERALVRRRVLSYAGPNGALAVSSFERPVWLAVCKTLASTGTRMQLFEYPSVRYWSKEINGTRTGGRKIFLLNIRADDAAMVQSGRAGGILSIPAPEVSLGLLRVGAIHG